MAIMQTWVHEPGITDLLTETSQLPECYGSMQGGNVQFRLIESSPSSSAFCQWCWQCICCYRCCPRGQRPTIMPWSSLKKKNETKGSSILTQEVYQKIKEIDNQTSTLTAAGVQGLSARVLEKFEYRQDLQDGTPEIFVCQTVELIKKPGQSLGLFLREGNDIQRFGVFVSRFGDESELAKYGDVIQPGDEILTVNNVDVSHMSIDDVVVIMSIPRRLVLRLRFVRNRRVPAWTLLNPQSQPNPIQKQKPIAIVKKQPASNNTTPALSREDSQESSFTEEGQPTPTARTSLGVKARQQLAELQKQQQAKQTDNIPDVILQQQRHRRSQQETEKSTTDQPSGSPQMYPSSSGGRWGYPGVQSPRQSSMHKPRVLDSRGQPMPGTNSIDTVSQTARVPPPRLLHGIRRAESLRNPCAILSQPGSSFTEQPSIGAANLFSPRSVASDSLADYYHTFTAADPRASVGRGPPPPIPPKPALRRQMAPTGSGIYPVAPNYSAGHKSNSLPRRRPGGGRTVKWRNDVVGGQSVNTPVETDSDGAISAPEFTLSPTFTGGGHTSVINSQPQRSWRYPPSGVPIGYSTLGPQLTGSGRTIDEVFSAQEYRNWAGFGTRQPVLPTDQRASRWSDMYDRQMRGGGPQLRSSSLPPRGILSQYTAASAAAADALSSSQRTSVPTSTSAGIYANYVPTDAQQSTYERLHVSPLMSRRPTPLRTAGPGWHVDDMEQTSQSSLPTAGLLTAMTGLLIIHILEGRGLKIPERQREWTDELYCVLEVDGEHRARTGVSTMQQRFRWMETFQIDILDARQTDFYIYSWHPQYRHKLCHRGSLKLVEAFVIDKLNCERTFALNLEPRGQLLIKVGFTNMAALFRRPMANRPSAYFGLDLLTLVERENTGMDVPVVLRRITEEIERRGVDSNGIYMLCGSSEKKRELRIYLEKDPLMADISADSVPDTNVLTSVLKDFLRELPQPLVPGCIYQMLFDASAVSLPNDREGNARLMLGVVDCMPRINKCTFMVLMDHFKCVTAQSPHNGMSVTKLSSVFGPLLLCATHPKSAMPPDIAASAAAAGLGSMMAAQKRSPVNFLDPRMSSNILAFLLDLWPGRVSSSDSSGSDNSTINMTHNGSLSILDVWLQNRLPESTC